MDRITIVISICIFMVMFIKTESAVTNIALNKKVSASSTFPHAGWGLDNAVDGVINQTHSSICGCCAATQSIEEVNAWIRVDLETVYMIHNLAVYMRIISSETLKKTDIFLHNNTSTLGSPATTITEATVTYHHTFSSPVAARYVTVKYRGQRLLALCEIQVFGECLDGTFGASCTSKCYCEGSPCNKTSGVCPSGRCIPGYAGTKCNEVCTAGYYGKYCSERCGHCRYKTCHHVNGVCSSCGDGYIGDKCKQECQAGKYGRNCAETCGYCRDNETCNHVNGDCTLCSDGYIGRHCNNECLSGTYGYNCSETCGHCYNSENCNHVDGTCKRCMTGYKGNLCKKYCRSGWYGQDCANQCGACSVVTCDPVSGVCTECSPGYRNEFCSETCLAGSYGNNCSKTCGSCYDNEPCDHVNGMCTRCMAGYKGNRCKENCISGWYGLDCKNQCGMCAVGPCHPVSGVCTNCSDGYRTVYCNETCIAGTFGINCNSTCGHCLRNNTCHHINGNCESRCESGYTGFNCSLASESLTGNKPGTSAAIGGAVGGVVVALVTAGIVVIIILRRRRIKRPQRDEGSDKNSRTSARLSTLFKRGKELVQNNYDHISNENSEGERKRTRKHAKTAASNRKKSAMKIKQTKEYNNFSSKNISVTELWNFVSAEKKNKFECLLNEFEMLPDGLTAKHDAAQAPENKGKSRYRGLYAYDHSRVILNIEDTPETDYINANYINGFHKEAKFIASQGPTKTMINDFWRMLWQKEIGIVVMLTNLFEMGANKCEQYWPVGEDGDAVSFGNIEVKLINIETFPDYDIRTLEAKKASVYTNETCHALRVTQYHFKAWPDKDVPDTTWCLVNFWRVVDHAARRSESKTPVVVHCSAGIGRTGTFIALDNLFYQAINKGHVNPFEVVSKLREQRVKMVQTAEQYVYLHEAAADSLLLGSHFVWASQMKEICLFMSQPYSNSKVTNYDQQFKRILDSIEGTEDDSSNCYCNIEFTPAAETFPMFVKSSFQVSRYFELLGAYYLPAFVREKGLILARTNGNMEQFWEMVMEEKVVTIILVTGKVENVGRPGKTDVELENGTVKLSAEERLSSFDMSSFSFDGNGKDNTVERTIRQFTFTAWDENSDVPRDTQSLITMINHVTSWQTQLQQRFPVVISCSDGSTRSGLVSVILNEINRIRSTGETVNIVESVKTMKDVNRKIISTSEQLRFCYEAVLRYLQQNSHCMNQTDDVYENV